MRNRHSTGIWVVYKNGRCVGRVLAPGFCTAMGIARSQFGPGNYWLSEVEA